MKAISWIDGLSLRVISHCARRTPGALAVRLQEEWQAHLFAEPDPLARLRHALGCWWAAMQMGNELSPVAETVAAAAVVCPVFAPAPHRRALFSQQPVAAGGDPMMCEINTTPLVDILLVLLVTLVVSLPLLTHAVKLTLPVPIAGRAVMPHEVIDLGLDFDGTVEWNGTAVASLQQLESYLRTESRKDPQPEIRFRPDHRVKYERVAQVLAAAQRNGISNLGFANISGLSD